MQVSVRASDGMVQQFGTSLGELEGCQIVELSAAEAERIERVLAAGRLVTLNLQSRVMTELDPPAVAIAAPVSLDWSSLSDAQKLDLLAKRLGVIPSA